MTTYLSQGEDSLLRANAASLDHDKVLLDQTVMGESTHGVDGLVGQVVVGGGVVLHQLKKKSFNACLRRFCGNVHKANKNDQSHGR